MASQHMKVKGLPIVAVHAYCYSYTVDQFKIDTQTWSVQYSYRLVHVGVEELHTPSLHVAKLSPFKT